MLGKTFKGLTDEMLRWQTEKLLALEVSRDAWTVYVRPELVVGDRLQRRPGVAAVSGGLALRFARVKRYRADKPAVRGRHAADGARDLRAPARLKPSLVRWGRCR